MSGASLRERKKAKLRADLVLVALRLFEEQGFDNTTLEQICAEVEVSPRTLLNHFPSKQDLVLAPLRDALASFSAALESRGSRPAVDVWRSFVEERGRRARSATGRRFHDIVDGNVQLSAGSAALQLHYEELLADAISREAGVVPATDLHAKVLAAALVGINTRVYLEWRGAGRRGDLVAALLEAIDYVIDNVRRPT